MTPYHPKVSDSYRMKYGIDFIGFVRDGVGRESDWR